MRPLLFVLFVVIPLTELAIIIQVHQVIGLDWTLLSLVAISVVGAVLVKREGVKAWRRFSDALAEGRMPTSEVVDGALLLFAGALLLTPGYLTDAVGLLLLLPLTRGVANHALRSRGRSAFGLDPARGRRSREPSGDEPIDVEVVDVRRSEESEPRDELGGGPSAEGR